MRMLADYGQEYRSTSEWRKGAIDRDLVVDVLLLASGAFVVLVSAGASYWSGDGTWFSRSGSLLILCGALVQYRYAMRRFGAATTLPTKECLGGSRATWLRRMCGQVSFWSVLMGTLVWGYGDLVIPRM